MKTSSKRSLEIYFPMSCRVLTVGHVKCLEKLIKMGFVTVGLLTGEAMKGYKQEIVPFEDRKYLLETIAMAIGKVDIVPQYELDPSKNIRKYHCNALASGDGFEPVELRAIKRYNLHRIDVSLHGEKTKGKKYSSSSILKRRSA